MVLVMGVLYMAIRRTNCGGASDAPVFIAWWWGAADKSNDEL